MAWLCRKLGIGSRYDQPPMSEQEPINEQESRRLKQLAEEMGLMCSDKCGCKAQRQAEEKRLLSIINLN